MSPIEILFLILTPILAGLILAVWLAIHFFNNRYYQKMTSIENTIRSLIIDYPKREIDFFDHNNLRKVRKIPLDEFYYQYTKNDSTRFEGWINELLKKNSTASDVFEIEVRLHKTRKKFYSLFHVTSVNKEAKIINLDSHLFPKLSARNRMTYQLRNLSVDESIRLLRIAPSLRGYTANFRFSAISSSGTKENISSLLFTQIKEIISGFVNPPQKQMINTGVSEFTVFDFKNNDYNEGINFVHKAVGMVRKYLEINGIVDEISISVGMVYNSYFPGNTRKLIEKAQEMSKVAFEKNSLIITYSKNMLNNLEEDKYDSEIEQIIRDKKIIYYFQAIYDIKSEKVIGYMSDPHLFHTSATNMADLYTRALKAGETKKLLQGLVKESFVIFNNLRKDQDLILFRQLKTGEANVYLSLHMSSDCKTVICFDEFDISYYTSKNTDFFDIIARYKAKKIGIALMLSDKTLVLDYKIYSLFDYFFVCANNVKARKNDNSVNLNLKAIIEKLIKYHKPIILKDAEGWSMIELFVNSGIQYLSSSTITPSSNQLLVPSEKEKNRLSKMLR